MRRALAVLFLLLLAPGADAADWHPAPAPRSGATLTVHPRRSSTYTVDLPALRRRLQTATVVRLPAPDGTLERFRVVPYASMAAGPARRASRFHGFAGRGVGDPSASVRLDYSVLGVHASVRSRRGTWFVDPAFAGRTRRYLSYFGASLRADGTHSERGPVGVAAPTGRSRRVLPAPGAPVVRRTYRVALASDPSYATAVAPGQSGGQLTASVNAAKQTLISRVDQIYNAELGVHLQLVADNALLNFNTQSQFTAAYTADVEDCYSDDAQALAQNQDVVDAKIGSAGYDLGHIAFGPDGDGGGIAQLGVVGRAGEKAQGCTGLSVPYGDFFAVDYVAHEMGHEFDATHTFEGNGGSCGGNRSKTNSVEPGSGSSIMAYAGICGDDDLQFHSDPYFSQRSIQQIQGYITANATQGGTAQTTANRSPVVTAPAASTVPIRTPFTLTGTATDQDDDPLVYTWEQNDPGTSSGGINLPSNSKANGPLFRQFGLRSTETDADAAYYAASGENHASAGDAVRSFPDAAQVAAGNTDAAGGTCPAFAGTPAQIDCYSEFLPTTARVLHFRLTARDLFPTGGGVSAADTAVTVAGTAPFRVTSTFAAADPGVQVPVTWDVAGTNAAPFNVASVSIAYSTDGGLTFPTVLTAETPNDGVQAVTLPSTTSPSARFRVAAVGAPFYDVSHADLDVVPGGGTPVIPPEPTTTPPEVTPAPSTEPAPTTSLAPTATAAATATTTPARAFLRPDLAKTAAS